jgi:TorA maturation chaperone TorD
MMQQMQNDKNTVLDEFEVLFNLPFGDFINSSVSFYHDEREFGAQTVATKEIMKDARYIKANFYSAGEDEFGYLCALSAKLLSDDKFELQKKLFFDVLLPYAGKFIDAILASKRADFYKDAATLFALVLAFEKSYFEFFGKL